MTSYVSYPRTDATLDDIVPSAALAHVHPLSLRKAILIRMAAHYAKLDQQYALRKHFVFRTPSPDSDDTGQRPDYEIRSQPELGAVQGEFPDQNIPKDYSAVASTWENEAEMGAGDRESFGGGILERPAFTEDTLIWRFIGGVIKDDLTYTSNIVNGSFMGIGPIPTTEAAWRSFFAIRGDWNGDGSYVCVRYGDLSPDQQKHLNTNGIVGTVAPQRSVAKGHYLAGGGRQLFLRTHNLFGGAREKTLTDILHLSAWNTNEI